MTNVTQLVPNFLGGVSQQSDIKKQSGQVRECINGYVNPTFGLVKRPGFQFLNTLATTSSTSPSSSELDDGYWFFYLRDNAEAYFGCITNGSPGSIYVWNAITRQQATVSYEGNARDYLDVAANAHTSYDVLTIQDTSIVTNKTKKTAMAAAPTNGIVKNSAATIQITRVEYSTKYTITINGTDCTVSTRNGDDISDPAGTTNILNATEILTSLKTSIDSKNLGVTVTQLTTSLEIVDDDGEAFTCSVNAGVAGNALFAFQTDVTNITQLPEESVADRTVQIVNSSATEQDNFWLKFTPDSGTSGKGVWKETSDPSASPGFNASTMPHELVSTAINTFVFRPIPWVARQTGNDTTNAPPLFIGQTINKVIFYQNRLCILSRDNIIFSVTGKVYDFFKFSAGTIRDSDPINLSTSNIRPSILFQALPVTQGLVIFSRTQQFLLTSVNGNLTLDNARITALSNYESDTDILPVDNGTTLAFVSKNSGYSKLFGYVTEGQNDNPIALDVSKVVANYIPKNINMLVSSPQNDFVALASNEDNAIYLFKSFTNGERVLLQSWTKWEVVGDVQSMAVINDTWFLISKNEDDSYTLSIAPIDQLQTGEIFQTNNGLYGNPAIDLYAHPSSIVSAQGTNADGKTVDGYKVYLTIPRLTGVTPVVLSTMSVDTTFEATTLYDLPLVRRTPVPYNTHADAPDGVVFNVTQTGTDGTGPFFFVPGSILEDYTTDQLLTGYLYDFQVDLPKMYYNASNSTTADYTAVNTIARYQFSTGLTGDLTFKIKSAGRDDYEQVQEVSMPGDYNANETQLLDEFVFNVPIHQRSQNFDFQVFSNSPFPTALVSMMWEGNYSPKYYKRK